MLQLAALDTTIEFLLLPLIEKLIREGFDVHVAATPGPHLDTVAANGVKVHGIPISRRIVTLGHLTSFVRLVRLMRRERFHIVHVHTPIAAVLGRIAAKLAHIPVIAYTAHGFYFHEEMPAWERRPIIWVERLLGRTCTDLLFTQSAEDRDTAIAERIVPADRAIWIGNGVDVDRFAMQRDENLRVGLGLEPGDRVIGFVGRLVREKGIWELLDALALLAPRYPRLKLLIIGDTLRSDRDRRTGRSIPDAVAEYGLTDRVVFTGFQSDTAPYYALMDLFVLPSHREGMPRTILEAMATGLPVVATNIRGCREEVVDGETGLLVPVNDPAAIAAAIERIVCAPQFARQLGEAGRLRAELHFRESDVLDRQMASIRRLLESNEREVEGAVNTWCKRALDVGVSLIGLALLSIPFLLIALSVRLDSPGPVFFRQERIGRGGRPFRVWKFRTMVVGAINQGLGVTVAADDERITRVGRILRNLGLDELPQLINVLMGEMSLVGPRPTLAYQVQHYDKTQRRRLEAKPGITSLAVVSGRNALTWARRIEIDLWYIEHASFWLDLKILARTLWCVLVTKEGLYGEDGVNDPFIGPPKRLMAKRKNLLIYGAGRHARVVLEAALACPDWRVVGLLDDDPSAHGKRILDVPVLGGIEAIGTDFSRDALVIVAIGTSRDRESVVTRLLAFGRRFATVIHPTAFVARGAGIGAGTAVLPMAVVHSDAAVGCHAIVNTGAIVEHDCRIGDFAHISPGAQLGGGVEVGLGAHVGIGASVAPGVRIGDWAVVGVGAAVIADVPDGAIVGGVPAQPLRKGNDL